MTVAKQDITADPRDCVTHMHLGPQPCPHCAEDAKILEEAIERVVDSMFPTNQTPPIALGRTAFRDALRDLVREIRR